MTWRKREIMEMAREAGINHSTSEFYSKEFEAFEKLVREDEREAAAKEAEAQGCHMVAAAIRARGQA